MQRRPPRSTLPYTLFPYTTLFRAIAETVATRAERESALAKVNAELAALRAELARAKAANIAVPDDHDYHEADTRRFLIDVLLREAGWEVGVNAAVEVPATGMPKAKGEGFVDYVLWGAAGQPLAVVEAKRSLNDPDVGRPQARLYAARTSTRLNARH